ENNVINANPDYVEIDLLSSYYSQDGENGAVTGGIGTEKLDDISTVFILNIPLDSTRSINASFGADYYSSASTDNIDFNPSSASSHDIRAYGNIGYTKLNLKSGFSYGGRIGFSTEYDYTSVSGGINLGQVFNNGNTEIALSLQAFIDQWSLYFPEELRGKVDVPTKSRNSYNSQLTLSQVISKKMQLSLSAELVYMDGLLSTPFHRVYFADNDGLDIERLPSTRLKIPVSLRLNYYISDLIKLRSYYRYYTDDYGINAHTASIELPINISESVTLFPFYRYHTQSASDYFAAYKTHLSTSEFYSSDYDLSELSSHKYGLGIEYSPLYGLGRMNIPFTGRVLNLYALSLRVSRYTRDTGLTAFSAAIGLNMRF
ncbi:MAG: DUF3570 domain-containing protein, partial [Saprospiraceae bacterium]|nr:DUF3570 domain-containing protein [Saprospiraceae bacterium]